MDLSLNQKTYDTIKKDIMTFALKPGEGVSAAKLAERYQVSRTPVREALVKLQAEGMVDIYPKSKSVISKININLAQQEWFLRKTLELGMVDAFFERVTASDIEKMESYYQKQLTFSDIAKTHEAAYQYLLSDNDFHAVTYHVAGEEISASIIKGTMTHYARLRLLVDLDGQNKDRTFNDHKQLIAYVKAADKEGYRRCLEHHLGYIKQDIERVRDIYPDIFVTE